MLRLIIVNALWLCLFFVCGRGMLLMRYVLQPCCRVSMEWCVRLFVCLSVCNRYIVANA